MAGDVALQSASRSFAAVLHDIVGNIQDVLRAEVGLAKIELRGELAQVAESSVFLVASAAFAIAGVFLLLLAGVLALSQVVPLLTATLIIAFSAATLAAVFGVSGMKRLRAISGLPKSDNVVGPC